VLKLHVVHVGHHGYYVEGRQFGHGDDFDVAIESPGAWTGPAAPSLGLGGVVDPETFGRVMEGFDPDSGRRLRLGRGAASVAGFDLTFCAPKSVSLLEALAPREIATEVGAGHDAAVAEASAYLSRTAVGVRRGSDRHGGRRLPPPDQSGPRSPSAYPCGGGQPGPRGRWHLVGGRRPAGLRPCSGGRALSVSMT